MVREVLEVALAKGGDFADIFIEQKKVTGMGCEGGRMERVHSGLDVGAGIRVIQGESTSYAYTNDVTPTGLVGAAQIVSHAAKGTQKEHHIQLRKVNPKINFDIQEWPDTVKTETKAEMMQLADTAARAVDQEKIKQVVVGYSDVIQNVLIANSLGEYVEDQRVRTRFVVQAVAAQNGMMQTGYEAVGGVSGFELLRTNSPANMAEIAAKRAVQMLEATPAPRGKMSVVMAGEAGGTMVHEACGHGLEADLVQKKLSVYAGQKGQQVAASQVTVIDDATMEKRYGSYAFDDEGTPAQKVTLIKNGVLQEFLHDRLSAMKADCTSNGHGRRESYQDKPIPRMANTYIAPGKDKSEDIVKQASNGLLVKKMGGGQVNPTTGDFVFEVSEGYLIDDGVVGSLVRGATLTGNGPDVLQNIEMIGNDLGFSIGVCGKDGQGVPVSDAQPTLLINNIVVGGTGGEQAKGKIKRL